MNYLLYAKDGVIKKFPLARRQILIGRDAACDIVLADPGVSKRHCRIEVANDRLHLVDQKSRNGTLVNGHRVGEASLALNESFDVGGCEFFFKRGDGREFAISKELSGMFSAMSRARRHHPGDNSDTRDTDSKFGMLLPMLLESAIQRDDFSPFLADLRRILAKVMPGGCLLLRHQQRTFVLGNACGGLQPDDFEPADMEGETTLPGLAAPLHCRRFVLSATGTSLLYLDDDPHRIRREALADFLRKLLEIVVFHLHLVPDLTFDPAPLPELFSTPTLTIVGRSPAMKRLVDIARKIAVKPTFVLVFGESGTGKELIAQMLHQLSGRAPLVAINCAAIPATLLESELFGHEAGAFTDAKTRKIGKIEESSGGTLVLDEIGDMPLEIQAKLLRVIQEKTLTRLGSNRAIPVELCIVAMTNHDLYRLVEEKRFRHDLFFRLRIHELTVPPLRERREDIPGLVQHFARMYAAQNGVAPAGFSETIFQCFTEYSWPGNVRELENEVRKIMEIVEDHELIGDHHLTPSIVAACRQPVKPPPPPADLPFHEALAAHEREALRRLLEQNGGNRSAVARTIGITYQGLLKKLKKLGLH